MGEIVNLRRARKRAARAEQADEAAQNRVRFGRTAAERAAERATDESREALLDGKRLEEPAAPSEE